MLYFLRRTSVCSSVSLNVLKNLFCIVKYSNVKVLMSRCKAKRSHVPTLPIRVHSSMITLFAPKRESHKPMEIESYSASVNLKSSRAIKELSEILQCPEEETQILYQNYNQLAEFTSHELKNRVNKLELYGIDKVTIKNYIWILFLGTNQLSARLGLLNNWKFTNLNNAVAILQLSLTKLKRFTSQAVKEFCVLDGKNKITYFSSFVKCHEKRACDLFVKYPFMMTLNAESLKEILIMLKDVGVLTEDLLNDPWLFRYSSQFIANRIQLLDDIDAKSKCKVIKAWMLRCPQSTLNRYFELKDENIAALGSYTNLIDLLTNELDLSDTEVEEMFAKHPPLAKISYSKAKEMIDFLKAEGFSSKMIYQVPRVLCHKQETLLARMLELKKVNPRMMSLQNLCRNRKDYLAFLNKVQVSHS